MFSASMRESPGPSLSIVQGALPARLWRCNGTRLHQTRSLFEFLLALRRGRVVSSLLRHPPSSPRRARHASWYGMADRRGGLAARRAARRRGAPPALRARPRRTRAACDRRRRPLASVPCAGRPYGPLPAYRVAPRLPYLSRTWHGRAQPALLPVAPALVLGDRAPRGGRRCRGVSARDPPRRGRRPGRGRRSLQASCPSCGGPCTFKVGASLVTVCPYCQSVVARGDRGLESLGKVADLVETASPLDIGVNGRFGGVPFELTGRTQFAHPAGGVWDEWYAAFADGRWGWIAEQRGEFYLTFAKPVPDGLPAYDRLRLGQKLDVGDGLMLTVAEKNRGKTAGARGEIPYRVVPR